MSTARKAIFLSLFHRMKLTHGYFELPESFKNEVREYQQNLT